jgi:IPT/TIG domain
VAVWIAAALVLVAAGALAVTLGMGTGGGGGNPTALAPPSPGPTTTVAKAHPARHHPTTAGGTAATSTTTSTAPPPVAASGPPVIASLSPASGSAGQGIQIAGSNFLSSSGQIVATFNGQVAPTSCPAQNTCSVTVPPSSGSGTAQVVVTTAGGTSNAMTFTYT